MSKPAKGLEWFASHIVAPVVAGLIVTAIGAAAIGAPPFDRDGQEESTDDVTRSAGLVSGQRNPATTAAAGGGAAAVTTVAEDGGTEDASGCTVGVGNPLATLVAEPEPFARELRKIPAGTYEVLDTATTPWAGGDTFWLRIEVGGSAGWIEDTTFNVDSKTSACG